MPSIRHPPKSRSVLTVTTMPSERVVDDDQGASVAHAADPLEMQRVIPTRDLAHAFCHTIRGDDRDRRDESVKIRDTDRQLGDVTLCREHALDRPRPRLIGRAAAGARRREQDGKDHSSVVAPAKYAVRGRRAARRATERRLRPQWGRCPRSHAPRPFRRRATRRRPSEPDAEGFDGFAAFDLDAASSLRSPSWATRSRRPSSARPSRCCWTAATSWPRRRPAPARPRPLPADPPAHHGRRGRPAHDERAGPRAHPRARDAGRRGVPRLRQALGARVVPVYGGQPIGQQLRGLGRASMSWWPRPAVRSITSSAAA